MNELVCGEEAGNICLADCSPVAAPTPIPRATYHLCSHRIEHNVPSHFQKVAFFLDKDRFESPLEDVACPLVVPIELLRVDTRPPSSLLDFGL